VLGVICLTSAVELIDWSVNELSLEVIASDSGHPVLSTVAKLRVRLLSVAEAADNETMWSPGDDDDGDSGWLLRSVLASDRLASVLAVLLTAVILTTALILLSSLLIDRRRRCCRCHLADALLDCANSSVPVRRGRRGRCRVTDAVTMSCCCCVDVNQRQQHCKASALSSEGDEDATEDRTADIHRSSTATAVSAAVRRVSYLLTTVIQRYFQHQIVSF